MKSKRRSTTLIYLCSEYRRENIVKSKMISYLLYFILFLTIFLYIYLTWNFNYWKKRGVCSPKPKLFHGNYPKTSRISTGMNLIKETHEIFL